MQDLYLEQIVKANRTKGAMVPRILFAVTVFFAAVTLLIDLRCIVLAVAAGVITYLMNSRRGYEYEYLYVNGELDVDVVKASRRKRLGSFQMEELVCMTLKDSPRLEGYKGQAMKNLDASTGASGNPIYAMIFKQNQGYLQLLVEPEEELMKIFQTTVPNKILN